MALAIKFQDMVDGCEVRDYADLARLGYVTRARVTQIMNMLLLAPDIQEEIIYFGGRASAATALAERHVRSVARFANWDLQRRLWRTQPSFCKATFNRSGDVGDGPARVSPVRRAVTGR
jgi:hypothetical protein